MSDTSDTSAIDEKNENATSNATGNLASNVINFFISVAIIVAVIIIYFFYSSLILFICKSY